MNAPNTVTRDEFAWREECCPECGGSGMRMGCTSEVECFDCGGEGKWCSSCADCLQDHPLNSDGVCAECAALDAVLDITVQTLAGERSGIWL